MKKDSVIVKEYCARVSDDELSSIVDKLTRPVNGDTADVSHLFEKDKEIDRWLCQAKSADDWFDKVDLIQDASVSEQKRRDRRRPKSK